MITLKKKKATETEHFHTDVFFNGKYIGYYMSGNNVKGSEWVFTSKEMSFPYFCAGTQNEVKETLNKIANGEAVDLKQHFGIILKDFVL